MHKILVKCTQIFPAEALEKRLFQGSPGKPQKGRKLIFPFLGSGGVFAKRYTQFAKSQYTGVLQIDGGPDAGGPCKFAVDCKLHAQTSLDSKIHPNPPNLPFNTPFIPHCVLWWSTATEWFGWPLGKRFCNSEPPEQAFWPAGKHSGHQSCMTNLLKSILGKHGQPFSEQAFCGQAFWAPFWASMGNQSL